MTTRRPLALSLAILCLAPSAASADPSGPKRREVSRALSIAGTLTSVAAIAIGAAARDSSTGRSLIVAGAASTLVTPSFGAWYAAQPLTVGMALRTGVVAMIGFVALATWRPCIRFDENSPPCQTVDIRYEQLAVGLGVAVYLAGIVYDVIDAPSTADRYNVQWNLRLAPSVIQTPSGTTPALGLTGRF